MFSPKIFKIFNTSKTLSKILNGSKTIVFGHLKNRKSENLLELKKLLNDSQSDFMNISPRVMKLLYNKNTKELYNISKANVIMIYPKDLDNSFNKTQLKKFLNIPNIQIIAMLDNSKLYRLNQIIKLQKLDDNTFIKQLFTIKAYSDQVSKNILKLKKDF